MKIRKRGASETKNSIWFQGDSTKQRRFLESAACFKIHGSDSSSFTLCWKITSDPGTLPEWKPTIKAAASLCSYLLDLMDILLIAQQRKCHKFSLQQEKSWFNEIKRGPGPWSCRGQGGKCLEEQEDVFMDRYQLVLFTFTSNKS